MNTPAGEKPKIICVVCCALLRRTNNGLEVLIEKRKAEGSYGGLWSFPGGKVENNEMPDTAMVRELKEELGITVKEEQLFEIGFNSHLYPAGPTIIPFYGCTKWEGEPKALDAETILWTSVDRLARPYNLKGFLPAGHHLALQLKLFEFASAAVRKDKSETIEHQKTVKEIKEQWYGGA